MIFLAGHSFYSMRMRYVLSTSFGHPSVSLSVIIALFLEDTLDGLEHFYLVLTIVSV